MKHTDCFLFIRGFAKRCILIGNQRIRSQDKAAWMNLRRGMCFTEGQDSDRFARGQIAGFVHIGSVRFKRDTGSVQ